MFWIIIIIPLMCFFLCSQSVSASISFTFQLFDSHFQATFYDVNSIRFSLRGCERVRPSCFGYDIPVYNGAPFQTGCQRCHHLRSQSQLTTVKQAVPRLLQKWFSQINLVSITRAESINAAIRLQPCSPLFLSLLSASIVVSLRLDQESLQPFLLLLQPSTVLIYQ